MRPVARPELTRVLAGALAAVLITGMAAESRADVSPPDGYDWLGRREVEVENVDAFPEWVFIANRCGPPGAMQEYQVVRPREALECIYGVLYALPAGAVRTRPIEPWSGPNAAPLQLVAPELTNANEFFEKDRRVVRPGLPLNGWGATIAKNVGVRAVRFRVRVDGVGPGGVKAHYTSVRYECKSGAIVELAWGRDQSAPPLPRCPVTDDHGELVGAFDGGVPAPGATAPPPAARPGGDSLRRGRTIWLGVLVTSLSLLGAGLLLRDRAESDPGTER
jgi:hypothetical protein